MEITNKTVTTNFFWKFLERCGSQGVTFIVSIVLARLLAPEVYGTIALVTVFTTLLQVFVNSGLGNALIQKKDSDDLDFSTVFYFNILFSLALYLLMFFVSPLIAALYGEPTLTPVLRVLSLTIVFSGIRNVQQAYVSKQMIFKKFFVVTLGATLGSAIIGIAMAYMNFGVWSLVGQQLSNAVLSAILLWVTVKWRPKKMFSFLRLKGLYSFGWKLLVSATIDTLYNDLRTLIIGKLYTTSDLAYYNKSKQFPHLIVNNVNLSIDSVLLPTMSSVQESKEKVKAMTRRAIKTSTYIMMPLMVGLAVCAEPLVRVVLTEKWMPCVPYLRIFCFTYAFYPIHTANLNAIKAMGRSDLFLKLEIAKKIVGLVLLFASMWYGVMAMAYTSLVTSVVSQIVNSWPNKKLLNYSYSEQLKDIFPQIILSIVMGACVYCVQFLNIAMGIRLIFQVVLGIIVYIAASVLFRIDSFKYVLGLLRKFNLKRGSL